MKRIIPIIATLLMLFPAIAGAQHYVGLRGGYGAGNIRTDPSSEKSLQAGLFNGGVSWKYYSAQKYLGGLEIDLQFVQKGYGMSPLGMKDTLYTHHVNAVELPFCWQPHLYVMKRDMRIFLNLGVVFSYNISASSDTTYKSKGVSFGGPYRMTLVRDNRWGYGLCGGLGVNYIVGRCEIMLEARYNFGYSDLFKNATKYPPNYYQRTPVDNMNISFGFYYRLGKGGILSPASPRVASQIRDREAKRAAKRAGAGPVAAGGEVSQGVNPTSTKPGEDKSAAPAVTAPSKAEAPAQPASGGKKAPEPNGEQPSAPQK